MELDEEQLVQTPKSRDRVEPRPYVLALLDKRLDKKKISKNQVCVDDLDYPKQFLRTSLHNSEYLSCKRWDDLPNPDKRCYVVEIRSKQPEIGMTEMITDFLMGDTPNEEWKDHDAESYTPKYQASALIFPDDQNVAVAYLFGNWKVLINRACMDRDFGLRLAASEGMSDNTDGPLQTIKSVTTGMYREENATLNVAKQREILGAFSDLNLGVEGSSLEGLRIRPKRGITTNSRLVDGFATFRFHYKVPTNFMKRPSFIGLLGDKAFELLGIYNDFPVKEDFEPHMESYVTPNSKTAEELNKKLDKFWDKYYQRGIITKGINLWSHINGVVPRKDQYEAKEKFNRAIEKGKSTAVVKIGNDELMVFDHIRVSCIYLHKSGEEKKFYRLEGGRWYKMAQSFVERSRKAIIRQIISSKELHLINAASKTEEEGIYNENAEKHINSGSQSGKLSALLLDKKLVSLGGYNCFELADILLRTNEGRKDNQHHYLIHVKKAKANQLSHHCEQVRTSARFMADYLDRSPVATTFAKGFVGRLYDELIDKPKKERFSFFQKKMEKQITPTQNEFEEMLASYVNSEQYKIVGHVRDIKEMIDNWDDWEEIYAEMSKFGDALYVWLDCMVDYLSTPINTNTTKDKKVDEMKSSLGKLADQLKVDKLFTESTLGILSRKKKSQITLVLAIITNTTPEKYLIDNRVSLIYDAMRVVEKCKFKFKITFIPVLEEGKMRQQTKVGKSIGLAKKIAKSCKPKSSLVNNLKGKALKTIRKSAKRKAMESVEKGGNEGQVAQKRRAQEVMLEEEALSQAASDSGKVVPGALKRRTLTTLRQGGNEGQQLAEKRRRMQRESTDLETLSLDTTCTPSTSNSGNLNPGNHNTGLNDSGFCESGFCDSGNYDSGNCYPENLNNPGKRNQGNHSSLGIVGVNNQVTANRDTGEAQTTNISRQTVQKVSACGRVTSKVAVVSGNSLNEVQITEGLEAGSSSSQNFSDLKENVEGAEKKSVAQSPSSPGKRRGRPLSEKTIKKQQKQQKQAEGERKGRVFMENWLNRK